MFNQALKLDYKVLLENKSKFILIHSSSGFKHALKGKSFVNFSILIFMLIVYEGLQAPADVINPMQDNLEAGPLQVGKCDEKFSKLHHKFKKL